MSRGTLSRLLAILAAIVLALAVVAGYASRAVFDADQFSNRATATLRDDRVRTVIARTITDRVVLRRNADLLAARPLIESVISGVVGSRAFTSVFRDAVRDVHRAAIDGDSDTVTLTVADIGTLIEGGLRVVAPRIAERLDGVEQVVVLRRDVSDVAAGLAHAAERTRHLALGLAIVALALAAAAIALAPDRRRAVVRLGIGTAVAGTVVAVGALLARAVLLAPLSPDGHAVARAVWDQFGAGLVTSGWVAALCGAIVAAAAGSVLRPVPSPEELGRVAARLLREPRRPALRAARAVTLVALGAGTLAAPSLAVRIVVLAGGVLLTYAGVDALLRLVYRPAAAAAPAPEPAPPRRRLRLRHAAAYVTAAALATVAVASFAGSDHVSAAAPRVGACNGHAELCDRTLPEVALVATHNSMSVPLPGWYSAEQDTSIAGQLRDGVRGLLLDTHYADRLANGRVRTVLDRGLIPGRDGVSEQALRAAERLRDRAGFRGSGTRGTYLCHSFCELGATRLASALDAIQDFLVTHPEEVVVVVNQDAITPADMVRAVRDAGLDRLAFTPPAAGEAWPTLLQMIDRDQRLVLLAEEHAGSAPWYQTAYTRLVQETPYAFGSAARLTGAGELRSTCRPNRGTGGAPLFLLNHWVSTDPLPRPSDAERVNAYEPLLRRARACQEIRGRLPNLVAVNFARRGDLQRVVDTLNGV